MAIDRIIKVRKPALFDRVIVGLQDGLARELPWLTHIFGRVERLVKQTEGVRRYTPNIYLGKDEYLLLTPDQGLGNYCFFVLGEGEQVTWDVGEQNRMEAPFSLVVWCDMRTVEDDDARNTEAVKAQILRAMNGNIRTRAGFAKIEEIYSHAENVFQGFTLDEVDNQFLMSPFAGWRFSGTMWVTDECAL